jgi:hypothetical protein
MRKWTTKIQNKLVKCKNIFRKMMILKLFSVISQSETKKSYKNNKIIMELTGKIIAVMQPRSGVSQRTGNSWMMQDYVMEIPGQYPRHMVFNIFGEDRIKQFNIQMGEDITVSFDIDAREFNGRWYNDIRAFNVTRGAVPAAAAAPAQGAPFAQPAAAPQDATSPFPPAQEPAGEGSADDLPF